MRSNHPKSGNEMQPGAGRLSKNVKFWSDRASANSLHPKGSDVVKSGSGKDRPLNHEGSGDYMPNVRREG